MEAKTVSYSKTIMSQIVLPEQANPAGNIHGGEIMKMMDNTAYVVARKHCRTNVVTARVDELEFYQPVVVGQLVTCKGQLVFVGRSSMEVLVQVEVEDLSSDQPPIVALKAFFTMVALDENCRPVEVPRLILETEEEKRAFEDGKKRYQTYKRRRQKRT
ncbi:MAG: acyl-CoA thioesterase [Clostridiales bacterium]|jgi:acyl-CoA hydrolase|nr:acyl-CoA thioesterase [Clostridiales bacterium]